MVIWAFELIGIDSPLERVEMSGNANQLRDYLSRITDLQENEWKRVESSLTVRAYKKGAVVHHQGDALNRVLFINSGLVRSYLIDCEGREFTWSIHFNDEDSKIENLFITDFASFIRSAPSQIHFEAIEDTEVIEIKKEDLKQWYSESHCWANVGRILTESAYCFTRDRSFSLLMKTATERYQLLMGENPRFLNRATQAHIASYLGVTPQSLSRIRKDMGIT